MVNFLTSRGPVSFSSWTLIRGISLVELGLVSSIGFIEVEFGCLSACEVLFSFLVLVLKMTNILKIKYFTYIATTPYRADKGVDSRYLNSVRF